MSKKAEVNKTDTKFKIGSNIVVIKGKKQFLDFIVWSEEDLNKIKE